MQDNRLGWFGVLIWVFVALVLFSAMAKAQTATEQAEWYKENSACRGGSGDKPETWKHCDRRDALSRKFEAAGLCYEPHPGEWRSCAAKAQTGMWDKLIIANGSIIPMHFPSLEACQQDIAQRDLPGTMKCIPASGNGVWGQAVQVGWGIFEDGTGQPFSNQVWVSQSECERYLQYRLEHQLAGAWSCAPARLYRK